MKGSNTSGGRCMSLSVMHPPSTDGLTRSPTKRSAAVMANSGLCLHRRHLRIAHHGVLQCGEFRDALPERRESTEHVPDGSRIEASAENDSLAGSRVVGSRIG